MSLLPAQDLFLSALLSLSALLAQAVVEGAEEAEALDSLRLLTCLELSFLRA